MSVYNQSRSRVVQAIFLTVFIIILVQLANLQLFSNDYGIQAENNAIYRKVVYPDRGIIYDRKGKSVLENTIMYDLMVTPAEIKGSDTAAICRILSIDTAEFRKRIITAIIKNTKYKPSVFEPLVSKEMYAQLNENLYKMPGFTITERPVRHYPYHCGAHFLGYIGEVDSSFLRKHEGEGYVPGDYTGLSGLERTYEKVLMGQRGVSRYIRDNRSRIQGPYENGRYDTSAIAGRALHTSIDIEVQSLAEKLLKNKIGAAVAINPKTGGIIALVSAPSYDPEALTGKERRKNFSRFFTDTATPLLNRAIKGQYPPGSTFKPLGALVALDEGLITPSYGYACGGAYYSCGRPVKCTHYGGGHAANLRLAIANSCNSYFCHLFRMALDNKTYANPQSGYIKWKEYMNAFGLGVKLQVDLPSEDKGSIPDTSRYNKDFGGFARWNSCNMVTLGIGQDRMTSTPLQLANVMAIIANKGYYYTPHFVDSIENETKEDKEFLRPYRTRHEVTHIADSSYMAVHKGMNDVTIYGTATRVKIEGVNICAKTGTAQNPHGKNHSLFVAFAPMENPTIAIAVIVENAGYGATWAAPIASLMMEQYLHDSISEKRKPEIDRISKTDLIPAAMKRWYFRKDSLRQAKQVVVNADTVPIIKSPVVTKPIQFDPEAEPERNNQNDSTSRQRPGDLQLPDTLKRIKNKKVPNG
jgi:penicillin-binding protein 2